MPQPMYVTKPTVQAAWALELAAIAGGTPKIELFTNLPSLIDTITYASLVLATGSWYAAKAAVLTPVYQYPTSNALAFSLNSVDWPYSGVSPGQTITGYALTDGAGNLFGVAMLENPVDMSVVGDVVITDVATVLLPSVNGVGA